MRAGEKTAKHLCVLGGVIDNTSLTAFTSAGNSGSSPWRKGGISLPNSSCVPNAYASMKEARHAVWDLAMYVDLHTASSCVKPGQVGWPSSQWPSRQGLVPLMQSCKKTFFVRYPDFQLKNVRNMYFVNFFII